MKQTGNMDTLKADVIHDHSIGISNSLVFIRNDTLRRVVAIRAIILRAAIFTSMKALLAIRKDLF